MTRGAYAKGQHSNTTITAFTHFITIANGQDLKTQRGTPVGERQLIEKQSQWHARAFLLCCHVEQYNANVIRGAVSSLNTHRHVASLDIAVSPCVAHTIHRQLTCR